MEVGIAVPDVRGPASRTRKREKRSRGCVIKGADDAVDNVYMYT